MLSLLAAAPVFVTLCLKPAPEGCLASPALIEAEVVSQRAEHGVEVRWFVDGVFVASDQVLELGPEVQRLAMILSPARIQHWVEVEIAGNGWRARDRLLLPPLCPSLVQLETFRWNPAGLEVRLSNLGPGSSGRVGLRWTINGLLYSKQSLDPLPAGGAAELRLPASASPLLQRALTAAGEGGKRSYLTPVVVRLEATPGPSDLENPVKSWQFFLGYAGAQKSSRRR